MSAAAEDPRRRSPHVAAALERPAGGAASPASRAGLRLSVIVPALDEAALIGATLERLARAEAVEIVVVDGGSADGTVAIAKARGVRVVRAERGRAPQMNAGAAVATGEALLFCHADTLLPPGYDDLVRATLDRPGVAAGAFDLRIDAPGRGPRLVERCVRWRSRARRLPYGDQGLFMRADLFRELGGFPALPVMEDYALVRALGARGTIAIAPGSVLTSGRRWRRHGVCLTTAVNAMVVAGYRLGVPARWLARMRGR